MTLPLKIIEGDIFGRLTVICEERKNGLKRNKRAFRLKCICGNEIVAILDSLRVGNTKSCGCMKIEQSKENIKLVKGTLCNTKHGMSHSKIYKVFRGIQQRCNNIKNKRYNSYGARGIKYEWNSFEEFYRDMGGSYKEGLEIDRIDVNGNYCKENCRWVTAIENSRNKQNTIWVDGLCLSEYCKKNSLNYKRIYARLQRGNSLESSLY